MKKSGITGILFTLLAGFFFFACTTPSASAPANDNTPLVTVKFDVNGIITKSVEIKKGTRLESSQKPADPEKEDNTFLYWAPSKASLATALPFDFDQQINHDTILYAIFSPKLASNAIKYLSSTQIHVQLASTKDNFPLLDGSYAGITFQHSTDGTNYQTYELYIPSACKVEDNVKYLIYKFPSSLSSVTHYFKVSDGLKTSSKSVTGIPDPRRVIFIDNDTTLKDIEVTSGTVLSSSQKPANPSKNYNYFMHWSKSKASQATATAFDLTTAITEDVTLYAIYTPKIDAAGITTFNSNTIEIKLYDTKVFPLDDGSYAGISFQHSTNGSSYTDYDLSVPSNSRDLSSYRYLTYTFPTPLAAGTHYFKVTNGTETKEMHLTITSTSSGSGSGSGSGSTGTGTGSTSGSGSGSDSGYYTVSFNDNGIIIDTINVAAGANIFSSQLPSNPSKAYNHFLYWSASKASKAAATQFNFAATPITQNLTLYAIYTPQLDSIKTISVNSITIKFKGTSSTTYYPLNDGSFAGLKIQKADGNNNMPYYDYNNFYPATPSKTAANEYTYYFNSVLGYGAYWFRATNGIENADKSAYFGL